MRHIGVLMHSPADEPKSQARLAAQQSGWAVGRNLRIDYRWSVEKAPARTLLPKSHAARVFTSAGHFGHYFPL